VIQPIFTPWKLELMPVELAGAAVSPDAHEVSAEGRIEAIAKPIADCFKNVRLEVFWSKSFF
jgi:hypothetical protein